MDDYVDVESVDVESGATADKPTFAENLGTYSPPAIACLGLIGGLVFWLIPGAIGMVSNIGGTKTVQLSLNDPIVYAIGAAEGTRTCGGAKTKAYEIHRDPGDRKINGGTFSAAARGNGITPSMTPEERDVAFLENINTALKSIDASKFSKLEFATIVDLKVQAHPDVYRKFVKTKGGEIVDRRVESFHFDGKNTSWTTTAKLRADQQRRHDRISECLGKQ